MSNTHTATQHPIKLPILGAVASSERRLSSPRSLVLVSLDWTRDKDPRVPLGHASLFAALADADVPTRSLILPVNAETALGPERVTDRVLSLVADAGETVELSAEATEDPIRTPAPTDLPHPTPGVGRAEHTVEVTLPVQHVWLVDSFPVESFEDLGDRVRVTVAVYSESWLDRLLVRLPEDATVHDAQGTDLWRRRGEVARRIMIAAGIDPSADSVSA